jgi:tetratricopeptide (TPR) repeat protein
MLAIERGGARFVWPDLDAPYYADPAAAVERLALKGWSQGGMTPDAPANHTSPAGRYLAADVTYLRTLMGQLDPLEAIAAYDRALRAAPGFPDAPRALVMMGFVSLHLGLAPEADTAFGRVLTEYPRSAHATIAQLGHATALRARRRFAEARGALDAVPEAVPAGVRCHVVAERAALARATGRPVEAVAADETLARECPGFYDLRATITERADSLLAVGRRADARRMLEQPSDVLDLESEAAALMRGADLAREDGDLDAARNGLERGLGLRVGPATRVRIQARLARLDVGVAPDRAVASLETLVTTAPTASVRADVIGQVAEALADAGRFEQALARLDRPDARDATDAEAMLAHRDAVLAHWLEQLAQRGDPIDLTTVYGRHRTSIDTRASTATARIVARALGRVGLAAPALRVLRLRDPGDEPVHSLAVAEAALAAGDPAAARTALSRLAGVALPDALASSRAAFGARLDAAEGHPERVASAPGSMTDAALAHDLARAWMARGDAAAARDAWDDAAEAYARAATLAPDAPAALVATAGLVAARASRAGEPDPSADRLAAIDDAVVRRAVALLATTRGFGVAPAGSTVEEHGHAR